MKYNVENLLKIKEDSIMIEGYSNAALSSTIVRAINIKRELEEIDKILLMPERTERDIMTHAQLIKEYTQNRTRQIEILHKSGNRLNDISLRLEKDYEETVKIIKA